MAQVFSKTVEGAREIASQAHSHVNSHEGRVVLEFPQYQETITLVLSKSEALFLASKISNIIGHILDAERKG